VKTGFVSHGSCLEHDTGHGHPERIERLANLRAVLGSEGILEELDRRDARRARVEELEAVHDPRHVAAVRDACARVSAGGVSSLDGDTRVSAGSWDAALRASGGILDAVERVLTGEWRDAFVAVRPPGHHAERDRAMGFCLFNNVAVAARALVEVHGLERVAILDWDVHHGNGTQHLFEEDASVFYASLHQWPLYPGTGAAGERGHGAGEGTTKNVPLPAGSGDGAWLEALEREVLPALEDFAPQFVLVSAGFDAHERDPLAGCLVTEAGYHAMTQRLAALADSCAAGRLVSILEGGYDLDALASSAAAHLAALRSR